MAPRRRNFLPLLALAPLALLSACSFSIVSGGGQAAYPYGQAYAQPYGTQGPRAPKPNPKANAPKPKKPSAPAPSSPQTNPRPGAKTTPAAQPGKGRPTPKAQPGKQRPTPKAQPGKPRPKAPESNTRPTRSKPTRAVMVSRPGKVKKASVTRRR